MVQCKIEKKNEGNFVYLLINRNKSDSRQNFHRERSVRILENILIRDNDNQYFLLSIIS